MVHSAILPSAGYLEVLNGALAGHLYPLQDDTVIGRSEEDITPASGHITLPDSSVSRRHTRIFFKQGIVYVEDLKSTNGTFLNAFRLVPDVPCRLKEGANLQIGNTHMRYRPPSKANFVRMNSQQRRYREAGDNTFNLSMITGGSQASQRNEISMIFVDSDVASQDVSLMLDASALINPLKDSTIEKTVGDKLSLKRLQAMAEISIQLGAETNRDVLFSKVMDFIFDLFPTAERAFIVLRDKDSLDTEDFIPAAASTRNKNSQDHFLSLSRSIVHEVVSQKKSILSTDAGSDKRFNSNQSIAGLGIRSVMCVPMLIDDEVIGLLQVDTHSQSHSFTREDLQIITGIAAQVAIALKNFHLYEEIESLFEGFVTASVHAIEARDPSTAGHSFRVAEYTERLARAVDRSDILIDTRFNTDQLRELRYAALLHDFGKVGVRENVLVKGKKLFPGQMELIEERFKHFLARVEAQAYLELIEHHAQLNPAEFQKEFRQIQKRLTQEQVRLLNLLQTIQQANEPTMHESHLAHEVLSANEFRLLNDQSVPFELLTQSELEALSLGRGSLTAAERKDIQSHVSHTYAFLQHIPWTGNLAGVPNIAHAHHEKLDGSGYPLGLKAEQIPVQAKIMTIADIFDALTSGDRPYKQSLSIEHALDILLEEGRRGKIDTSLVDIFVESKSYQLLDVQ